MNQPNIGKNIAELRKKAGITQENLAKELNISAQAISKWETNTCLPDTQTLPLIAAYFNVSIDFLFYGEDAAYDDLYKKIQTKVISYPQMSADSYEEALKCFAAAHHGISHGNLRGKELYYDEPSHISDENGLSLLSGKGYGAVVTRRFFENITEETLTFIVPVMRALSDLSVLRITTAIVSMSDVSFFELKEKLSMADDELRRALDILIEAGLIAEHDSKHKSLGKTYEITGRYHTCICILLATMEMQRYSLQGISCCMGYGDYPVKIGG